MLKVDSEKSHHVQKLISSLKKNLQQRSLSALLRNLFSQTFLDIFFYNTAMVKQLKAADVKNLDLITTDATVAINLINF